MTASKQGTIVSIALTISLSACGGSSTAELGEACDPSDSEPCVEGLLCAEVSGGEDANVCFSPVFIRGSVVDSQTGAAIEGARVIALDDQSTPVSDVAISAADGTYSLEVPQLIRDADGKPLPASFTLRASAANYQAFPSGIRTALPINSADAVDMMDGWTIQTPPTVIALIALPGDQQGQTTISGSVVSEAGTAGVLVVAESATAGFSAPTDAGGSYTIFNVPDGAHTVRGYAVGTQLTPVDVVVAGADLTDVDLVDSGAALSTLSGTINIVNAPGESATSVVLVVASTFDDTFVRGEVPRGLRTPLSGAPDVTGAWVIPDVPDGDYVILAAFENDDLVRDPDPNIAGTQIVSITLPGAESAIAIDTSFKVTEALPVIGPGAELAEAVADPPTLTWGDDSSEDFYSVVVYDSFGNLVWEDMDVPSVSGSETVSVEYDGPELEPGIYYQFRATSWRSPGGMPGPISVTEDLRGVFFVE